MSNWKPFATAPKDGTPFLAHWKDNSRYEAHGIVFYEPESSVEKWFEIEGSYCTRELLRGRGRLPTHWMPLPDAPSGLQVLAEADQRLDSIEARIERLEMRGE